MSVHMYIHVAAEYVNYAFGSPRFYVCDETVIYLGCINLYKSSYDVIHTSCIPVDEHEVT